MGYYGGKALSIYIIIQKTLDISEISKREYVVFSSECCKYVLLPLVSKDAVPANGLTE